MIMHADDAHDEAMQAGELTANLSCICPQLYPPMMPPAIIPSPGWCATVDSYLTFDTINNAPTMVGTQVARTMDT